MNNILEYDGCVMKVQYNGYYVHSLEWIQNEFAIGYWNAMNEPSFNEYTMDVILHD